MEMSGPWLKTIAFAAALMWTAPLAAQDAQSPALPEPSELQTLLERADVPGMTMAVISDCAVEQVVAVGLADVESGLQTTPHTAFEAASLSKPVFAWLVMSVVEEGAIDLDRPIALDMEYPRIADQHAYAKITPRMILSHRTGLPNWVGEDQDFYERTVSIPSLSPPDEVFSYSGEAFQLLQAWVEQVTGKPLEQVFRERLGDVMPHSSWVLPLRDGTTRSRGYRRASEPQTGRPLGDGDEAFTRGLAAGSLITTAGDYGAFIAHVCARQDLTGETYETMFAPVTPVDDEGGHTESHFALGWNVREMGPTTLIGHDGNNDEYRTIAGFLPRNGEGFVILTNGSNGFAVIEAILSPPPKQGQP